MPSESQTRETSVSATWAQRLVPRDLQTLRYLPRIGQAADSITKWFFLAAYEASDDAYWRKCTTRYEWQSLGGIIEFTPDLLAVSGERSAPVYLISIRTGAKTHLERLSIKVKVKKSGVIYEQEITQHHLCSIPVRKSLTAIPLRSRTSECGGRHKLGDIYIKLSEAVDVEGVDLVKDKKIAAIFPSTGTDSGPNVHLERWGQYWNIDAINFLKDDIKTCYYRELVQSARKLGRPLTMRRMAYRLLTSRVGLTLIFWFGNLWNAKGIRTAIAEADATPQHVPSKQRGAAAT